MTYTYSKYTYTQNTESIYVGCDFKHPRPVLRMPDHHTTPMNEIVSIWDRSPTIPKMAGVLSKLKVGWRTKLSCPLSLRSPRPPPGD